MKKLLVVIVLYLLLFITACTNQAESNNPFDSAGFDFTGDNPLCLSDTDGVEGANYLADKIFDTDEYMPDYDADAGALLPNSAICHFCEGKTKGKADGIYYYTPMQDSRTIHYLDKSLLIDDVLCIKPECSHDDKSCGAYVPDIHGLTVYDGRLCWLGGTQDNSGDMYIYSSALDGTDRKAQRSVDVYKYPHEYSSNNSFDSVIFHRGYMYVGYTLPVIEDGIPYTYVILTQTPMTKKGETVELIRAKVATDSGKLLVLPKGNYIYVSFSAELRDDDHISLGIYQFDTKKGSIKVLYGGSSPISVSYMNVTDDGKLYLSSGSQRIFAKDDESQEISQIHSFDEAKYERLYMGRQYIVACGGGYYGNEAIAYCIADYDFNIIAEGSFDNIFDDESRGELFSCSADMSYIGIDEVIWQVNCTYKSGDGTDNVIYQVGVPYDSGTPRVYDVYEYTNR